MFCGSIPLESRVVHGRSKGLLQTVEPYASIIGNPADRQAGIEMLKRIEFAARISHRSEGRQTDDSWQTFIPRVVMSMGHVSVIEHENVTVEVVADRAIINEIQRHRLSAFVQESTRYVKYENADGGLCVIIPPEFQDGHWCHPEHDCPLNNWYYAVRRAEKSYNALRRNGVNPEIARAVLPLCLASKLIWTMNLRSWRHVLALRTSSASHPQLQQILIPLLRQFQERIPFLFDDIEPNASPAVVNRMLQ